MTLITIIPWIQIVLSVVMVVLILLQSSEGGLGGAFGGDSGGGSYHTKRGLERTLFIATIIVGVLFGLLAIVSLLLNT